MLSLLEKPDSCFNLDNFRMEPLKLMIFRLLLEDVVTMSQQMTGNETHDAVTSEKIQAMPNEVLVLLSVHQSYYLLLREE